MTNNFIVRTLIVFLLLIVSVPLSAVEMGHKDIHHYMPVIKQFFPALKQVEPLTGTPPSSAVMGDKRVLGYVFFTDDIVKIPAYSGKPISTLVAIDLNGKILGLRIVHHEEPILLIGISDQNLQSFIDQYSGKYVSDKIKIGGSDRDGYRTIDTISGATITVMVLNATINKAMKAVAAARGILVSDNKKSADMGELDPVWQYVWKQKTFQIVVLSIGLFVLLFILVVQDWLAKHPNILSYLRTGFLVYTVVFIGWYGLAQLSIVNVFTFINSFLHNFNWDNFLVDPMMFMLWGFVAMTILLWGRGVYCGWLCPFGAMQELLFRIGEKFKLPTYEFPEVVHERLWAVKYLILLGLFAVSLQSLSTAEKLAEVEPFKTAITLHFAREWSYVLYALVLLVVSIFNRKFYCRYICPLGAALTFPSKFRIFDWLRRYKECGRPCQICRNECEVRAIRSTGEIIVNECHYCLDCQVTYWNAYKCPPVVQKRKKQEKSIELAEEEK